MNIKFENIDYLKTGNDRQRLAYDVLTKNKIFTILQAFDPILVGTIPINIDIETSDLDIICYCKDQADFISLIKDNYRNAKDFKIRERKIQGHNAIVANFRADGFEIEIFGQDIPTKLQNAYRHMIIEHRLLCENGEAFRQKIIDLKRLGHKTEPAFGIVLGLTGNPYLELLTYGNK